MFDRPLVSLVIPCFNEEAVLRSTNREVMETLGDKEDFDLEVIYVDDGSRDQTLEILRELRSQDSRVHIVAFSRNFGHQNAVSAGLQYARGDAVVLMDADLQDPPSAVLGFIEKWWEGYHVVYGVRASREGETRFKLWTAKMFYRFLNMLSEIPIPLDTGDFRLMDRKVVQVLNNMPEQDRFIRGMVTWVGFNQCELPYHRAARKAGTSKYPLFKMLRFAMDGLASFSTAPLRAAINLGFISIGLSIAGILYALFMRLFTNIWVSGWTFLVIALLFFSGVQLFSLGIIGEYVGRIYRQVKGRPLFVVKEAIGFDPEAGKDNSQ